MNFMDLISRIRLVEIWGWGRKGERRDGRRKENRFPPRYVFVIDRVVRVYSAIHGSRLLLPCAREKFLLSKYRVHILSLSLSLSRGVVRRYTRRLKSWHASPLPRSPSPSPSTRVRACRVRRGKSATRTYETLTRLIVYIKVNPSGRKEGVRISPFTPVISSRRDFYRVNSSMRRDLRTQQSGSSPLRRRTDLCPS